MRITQWGEFGVFCSMFIAQSTGAGRPTVSASEIAESQNLDLQYAQQILQRLRKGGIIESVRGPQGGYRLTRPATEITLRDILVAAEGDTFEVICETKPIDSHRCDPAVHCNVRPIWMQLKEHINEFLTARTLESLARGSSVEHAPIQITPHDRSDAPKPDDQGASERSAR